MKIWTTQKDIVLEHILNTGNYEPDFVKSEGMSNDGMKRVYWPLLDVYKKVNGIDCKGLIFAVSELDGKTIDTIDEYNNYFLENPMYSDSISLFGENYTVLELNVDDTINIVPFYLQDFIIMGQRHLQLDEHYDYVKPELQGIPYNTFEFDLRIAQTYGWMVDFIDLYGDPSLYKIVQAHIHKIEVKDIVGVYPTTDYNKGIEYPLGAKAKELKSIIEK